jgi:glycosyltransferase involved in cell wall biosynthesis
MKILWFANTPSLYDQCKYNYNGYGWVASLQTLINNYSEIELGVSFIHHTDFRKSIIDGTTYYPILKPSRKQNPIWHILNVWSNDSIFEKKLISKMLSVIKDFKPDLIHIFGTDDLFISIQNYTNIPVIIHLQGIINPLLNSYFPIDHNRITLKYSKYFILKNLFGLGKLSDYNRFKKQAIRETNCLRITKFVMGRTNFDSRLVKLYNPNVNYFHVDEVLRPPFYISENYKIYKKNKIDKIVLVSTISSTIYKGIDVILKTAKLLKEESGIDFEWKIIGLNEHDKLLKYFITATGILPNNVNVIFSGIKSPEQIVELLKEADIFIHPSYIDNSPNSVCEAQIMGVPVIACNVGGASTIVEHMLTGILIPANGIFELTSWIIELLNNDDLKLYLSNNSKLQAKNRHNKSKIITDLLSVYEFVTKKSNFYS